MAPPICPCAEDVHSKSSNEEDSYRQSDEVASDPPTLELFWGRYDLWLWKSLPPAEKDKQVAFKKDMVENKVKYEAACEAREAAWKKEAVELWRWARRRAEELYADGYFARKVKGARCLITAWRWDDKLQRATDEELMWASNQMARSFMLVRQQEADWYVKRCETEVVDLAMEEVDFLVEGEDDVLHGLAIHLEIMGVVRDHEIWVDDVVEELFLGGA
ncbi:Actin-related protein 2 [Hordeum vulgare]|nr:Actin-related protein 2 [Hordeum vulgare]